MTTGSDSSEGQPAAAAANPAAPSLTVVQFPDGTGHIGVAPGWTPQYLGQGQAVLVRPDGAQVSMGVGVGVLDPNGMMYKWYESSGAPRPPGIVLPYPANSVQALIDVAAAIAKLNGKPDPETKITAAQARGPGEPPPAGTFVSGTDVIDGTFRQFRGIVYLSPPSPQGGWFISLCVVSGPDATFAHDEATMQAMFNSYFVDAAARQKQIEKNAADLAAAQAATTAAGAQYAQQNAEMVATSRADATAAQHRIDASTANFIRSEFES